MIVTLHDTPIGTLAYETGTHAFQQALRVCFAEHVSPCCVAYSENNVMPTIATREIPFVYFGTNAEGVLQYAPAGARI